MSPEEIAAAFAAEGWAITTIAEACAELEALSAGWRAQAVETFNWKTAHHAHCGLADCEYRTPEKAAVPDSNSEKVVSLGTEENQ